MTLRAPRVLTLAGAAALAAQLGCSLGQGSGEVKSDHLVARDCWNDTYDMQPDFFAAVPYRETLQIRVQRGTDLQEVSDGLAVLVEHIDVIRDRIKTSGASVTVPVSMPPGVAPPGSPLGGNPPPADAGASDAGADGGAPDGGAPSTVETPVHMALYLQRSCHNQNTVLYSLSGAITFAHLFSGDPQEQDAAEKRTEASSFEVEVGDPRDAPLGTPAAELESAIPAELKSTITGKFVFYFERGQPGQPFP